MMMMMILKYKPTNKDPNPTDPTNPGLYHYNLKPKPHCPKRHGHKDKQTMTSTRSIAL